MRQERESPMAMNSPFNGEMYIDGQWRRSESGETFDAINPAKGEPFGKISKGTRKDAQLAIAAASAAQKTWRQVPLWERAALCVRMSEIIAAHREDLADILCT